MAGHVFTKSFLHRRRIVAACVIAVAAGLIWRVVDLQLNHNAFLKEEGDARHLRVEKIPAYRGMLLDRNGEPLAVSTPLASVWVNPKKLVNSRPQWPDLESVLALDRGSIEQVMEERSEREFVYLRRHVDPSVAEEVRTLDMDGVHLKPEYRRYYPMGAAAGHVLGFTGIDDAGQEGLELAFDDVLSGENGARRVIKDRLGRIVENLERISPARPGRDVVLSIDRRIQSLAYRALRQGVQRHRARAGSAVVLDVRTGEVLAVANQPSFNPNDRGDRSSWRFRNRAVTDLLEPGSTIKPFTVAAALHAGIVRPDTEMDTRPGFLKVGRHTVWDVRNYGVIDVRRVIKKSSNVGAGKLALELRPADLWQMFHQVGLGTSTGSGFPGEGGGTLTDFVGWGEIHRVTLSFGYGLAATPLQIARAYAAFGTGGVLPAVSFVRTDEALPASQAIPAPIAAQILGMLEAVVEPGGTGRRARVAGYRVGGKTGTTRKSEAGGYSEDRYHAAFAGLAPMSDPRLSVVVVIDEPGGDEYYGGAVAAPVFSDIVDGSLRVLGIAPDDPETIRSPVFSIASASPDRTSERTP
ncbi:MAG: penicillin-binding protein 2 [Thiotrichales bacterium]|nr:penicillin-binding protein 2 [Thiotrichales bacterium]